MRVLCLHRVVDRLTEEVWPYRLRGTAITTQELDELLGCLRRKLVPVRAGELLETLRSGDHHDTFTITFDDGYRDNITYAAEVLKPHGLDATLFYVTGLADGLSLPVDQWYWMFTQPGASRFTLPWVTSVTTSTVKVQTPGPLSCQGR